MKIIMKNILIGLILLIMVSCNSNYENSVFSGKIIDKEEISVSDHMVNHSVGYYYLFLIDGSNDRIVLYSDIELLIMDNCGYNILLGTRSDKILIPILTKKYEYVYYVKDIYERKNESDKRYNILFR